MFHGAAQTTSATPNCVQDELIVESTSKDKDAINDSIKSVNGTLERTVTLDDGKYYVPDQDRQE